MDWVQVITLIQWLIAVASTLRALWIAPEDYKGPSHISLIIFLALVSIPFCRVFGIF